MDNSILTFKYSSGFVLLIFILAVGVAYFFYRKQKINPSIARNLLMTARVVSLFTLALLLVEPITRSFTNVEEKAKLVLLVDDSESIKLNGKVDSAAFVQQIFSYKKQKEQEGFDVEIRTLNHSVANEITFEGKFSNIQEALANIQKDYNGANLKSVLLFTDGIANQGLGLKNQVFPFSVNTIGLGDTLAKKDLQVKELKYNKEVNKDNFYFIESKVLADNFSGEKIEIELLKEGKLIERKTVSVNSNKELVKSRFKLLAEKEGVQVYDLRVKENIEEFNLQNNNKKAFINVIKRARKVLILAEAPHPDVKVFTKALDKNQTVEADVVYAFSNENVKLSEYSLVILFHANLYKSKMTALLEKVKNAKLPVLFTYSAQRPINGFNGFQDLVEEKPKTGTDQVHGSINKNFAKFTVQELDFNLLKNAPPLDIQFSDFKLVSASEILLNQQIGSLATEKPLLVIGRDKAVLLGEGYFRWSIFEGMNIGATNNVETVLAKTIQYLVSKANQDQFNVYPVKSTFKIYQAPEFYIEVYNSLLEPVYGNEIEFEVTDENKESVLKTKLKTVTGKAKYNLSLLKDGVYTFSAKTYMDGKEYTEKGSFLVENNLIEQEDLVADFEMLQRLSKNNKGEFIELADFPEKSFKISNTKKIHTQERELSAIHFKWLAILVFLTLVLEWFFRKRLSGKP